MMRFIAVLLTGGLLFACGGISGGGLDDDGGGNDDGGKKNDSGSDATPDPIDCNGHACFTYCIHPSTTTCPTCTLAPDSGTCPAGSTFQTYCPAGPPMQGDGFCVTYPSPDPPFCSESIPSSCFPTNQPAMPGDVTCMEAVCAS